MSFANHELRSPKRSGEGRSRLRGRASIAAGVPVSTADVAGALLAGCLSPFVS